MSSAHAPGGTAGHILRLGSGTPWEPVVGYSRVVRAGQLVLVSGTTASAPGGDPPAGMAAQAAVAMERVRDALRRAGAEPADVVQTRLFVTDIGLWDEVARAHREVFGADPPAATMVEVTRLIDPALLIEVEAVAWVGPGAPAADARGDASADYA